MSGSATRLCHSQVTDDPISSSWQEVAEDQAERELARLRWSGTRQCPFCGSTDTYTLNLRTVNRRRYKCRSCRQQFSVTKGTILEGSKLSLASWIRLIQMLCEKDADLSVATVSRRLNVSYGAARNALDRLMYAARREPFSSRLRNPDITR
jgi:AhpD family alkylhydroperoxidase